MSTTEKPLVTIGIPAHNSGGYLAATIKSALDQTYENLEVLVVDDGSTDDSLAVAASFDDPRLNVLSFENEGLAAAHNRLLELAAGTYLKILHGDDLITPEAIERLVSALGAHPSAVIATSRRTIVDERGKRLMARGPKWREGLHPGVDVAREIVRSGQNLLGEPSAHLFDRERGIAVGGFSAEWPYAVDLEFSMRLLEHGDLAFVPEELCSYRVHGDQVSMQVVDSQRSDMERLLTRLQERWSDSVTAADLRRGVRRMRRDATLRRLLYGVLSLSPDTREKFAYLVVGGWNTVFSYLVFALLWALMGESAPYWAVLTLSTVISVVNSFVNQRRFVFRSTGSVFAEFARFSVVYLFLLAVNIVAFPALTKVLGMNPYVAQLVYMVFVVVFGYIANKYFSFKERPEASA